jgi:mono/diheme cytochrome c family protein
MKRTATFVVLFAIATGGVHSRQNRASSTSGALFTQAQAQRGQALYESKCGSCHGMKLVADEPEAGDLTGLTYQTNWHGKTLAEKFEVIKTTMPPGSARLLTDQEYLDVVVYVLKFNGYPTGSKELLYDPKVLQTIRIRPQ